MRFASHRQAVLGSTDDLKGVVYVCSTPQSPGGRGRCLTSPCHSYTWYDDYDACLQAGAVSWDGSGDDRDILSM